MPTSDPVIVIDSEWGYTDRRIGCESAFMPVVLCAQVLGGECHVFWARDRHRLAEFLVRYRDAYWVAHSATAEMKYLLRVGLQPPEKWWDTMVGYRVAANRSGYLSAALVDALGASGLADLIPPNKNEMREAILNLQFAPEDEPAIAEYCMADVRATAALYARLVDRLDPATMQHWCEYLRAVARMELRGIPIDTAALVRIWNGREHIAEALRDKLNRTARVYRHDGTFDCGAFFGWLRAQKIAWPQSLGKNGWYDPLDDDTLEAMEKRHPFIEELRQTRKSLRSIMDHVMLVDGVTRRHYYSTMPFRSVTGRNQPSQFIFSGPKWLRWLITPASPDHVLVYADFAAEEIGIAAALSGDEAMQSMYAADDPHLAFAVRAGAAPATATKDTHGDIRDQYKTVNLAVLYAQTPYGIADRLGIDLYESKLLLRQHESLFRKYHEWSKRVVATAVQRRTIHTRCGWKAHVEPGTKWRTWANFPVQAGAADVMRVMTLVLDRQNVQILAIVHDGWLLSCRKGQLEQLRAAVGHARRVTCDTLLNGFQLKLDIAVYRDCFEDKKGKKAWDFIRSVLPRELPEIEPA
ncbi:dna polymerase i : DNA polymerase, putative OS=Pelobacter carbinolicus (strain DSM 2380 / Gra Bd 1) GN=Pcar_0797 PE=4 SV=1: DNA_pol_A [Gemmata massiliana]|uniref:DNA-directed DNA polymerase n=1 Tax=Gemmata massiliana TaxID=1210884 RepID=A0A6P2CZN9_9BACT|nr:DNA polymerase [Gemmata massiliana]VTR94313.1 dna polymerase i : DNA polymerase, putative OS=Pelobacter carbinolicus (strain DSM 2380 / Gra Bd 1) GN=Pcar_0797 PE=4 SV=1: DNA_pol_A [Gemmata massiliana]